MGLGLGLGFVLGLGLGSGSGSGSGLGLGLEEQPSDQFIKKMRELLGKAPDRGRAPPKRPLRTPLARRPAAPVPFPKR